MSKNLNWQRVAFELASRIPVIEAAPLSVATAREVYGHLRNGQWKGALAKTVSGVAQITLDSLGAGMLGPAEVIGRDAVALAAAWIEKKTLHTSYLSDPSSLLVPAGASLLMGLGDNISDKDGEPASHGTIKPVRPLRGTTPSKMTPEEYNTALRKACEEPGFE